MAIMRQVAQQLRERIGIKLKPGYFKQRWEELKQFFGSEVKLESLELESGLGNFTAAIKSSPSTRDEIRKALGANDRQLDRSSKRLLGKASVRQSRRDYTGIAIIADDLDKLSVVHQPEMDGSVADRLFLKRRDQLAAFRCPVICTIPLSLMYSCKGQQMANLYGMTAPPVVPMTKIFEHTARGTRRDSRSSARSLARRLKQAEAEEKTFSPATP